MMAAAPPPAARLPDQGAIKNELVQARRRESEMSTRMAALEAEVKQSKAFREDQTAKITELSERVQVSLSIHLRTSRRGTEARVDILSSAICVIHKVSSCMSFVIYLPETLHILNLALHAA
jgi:hypothetical protein